MLRFCAISAIVANLGTVFCANAATVPAADLVETPMTIEFGELRPVTVWVGESEPIASCQVGRLRPLNESEDATDEPETLIGRLMMLRKEKGEKSEDNVLGTAPTPVLFTPEPNTSCEDIPPPPCDCELVFFVLGTETGSTVSNEAESILPSLYPASGTNYIAHSEPNPRPTGGGSGSSGSGGSDDETDGSDDGSAETDGGTSEGGGSGTTGSGAGSSSEEGGNEETLNLEDGTFEDDSNSVLLLDFARVTTNEGSSIFAFDPEDEDFSSLNGNWAICGLDPGFWCTADLFVDFYDPVHYLTFETYFFGGDDNILATIFAGDAKLDSIQITDNGLVDFSLWEGITRLVLSDSSPQRSGSAGAAFGSFTFSAELVSDVPLPASMFGSALGVLVFWGAGRIRRKQKLGDDIAGS